MSHFLSFTYFGSTAVSNNTEQHTRSKACNRQYTNEFFSLDGITALPYNHSTLTRGIKIDLWSGFLLQRYFKIVFQDFLLLFRSCVSRRFHLTIPIELSLVYQLGPYRRFCNISLHWRNVLILWISFKNIGFSKQQLCCCIYYILFYISCYIYSGIRKKIFTQHQHLFWKAYWALYLR